MFGWFKKHGKETQEELTDKLLKKAESMSRQIDALVAPKGMFFIKTQAGTFVGTQLKSIQRTRDIIELKFSDTSYNFKSSKPKQVYEAIVTAVANAAAKLVPCTINEAPTPYGMFSYCENPYPGPTGEDLIVDIDSIVKEVRG